MSQKYIYLSFCAFNGFKSELIFMRTFLKKKRKFPNQDENLYCRRQCDTEGFGINYSEVKHPTLLTYPLCSFSNLICKMGSIIFMS